MAEYDNGQHQCCRQNIIQRAFRLFALHLCGGYLELSSGIRFHFYSHNRIKRAYYSILSPKINHKTQRPVNMAENWV